MNENETTLFDASPAKTDRILAVGVKYMGQDNNRLYTYLCPLWYPAPNVGDLAMVPVTHKGTDTYACAVVHQLLSEIPDVKYSLKTAICFADLGIHETMLEEAK